jgi:hypothetical protein
MTLQEKKIKMAAIILDWQTSGLSQVEYAGIHGFKLNTFRYWVSKQRQSGEKQAAFIQIGGAVTRIIHIRYPHGVELILPFQTPAGLLRSLINF